MLRVILSVLFACAFVGAALGEPAQWKREGWTKTDFSRTAIKWAEVLSGGPPKDGIPSIDKPMFKPLAEVADLADVDPVVSLELAGDARAYPLRVLIWHEIVNDVVGGKPVTVTYCPLCNSAVVFDRRVGERLLDFGTTGKLRHSDLVMYDRQTESWWQQFTGEAIVGAMVGQSLAIIPARFESFDRFRARHPDGKVLVPSNKGLRPYGSNPYSGYDTAAQPFLFRGELPEGISPMARVVVVKADRAKPFVVALTHLRKAGRLSLGGVDLAWHPGQASAIDASEIAKGRDVGTVEVTRQAADGSVALVPYDVTFAFVAHAFHPDVPILQE
jgi:hypothetical protein